MEAKFLTPKKAQKVVAAYPHPHEVSARFHKCWDALRQYDFTHNQRIANGGGHLPNSSGANVTNARNEIVKAFLDQHDADWLWFIDTDMTFPPDILDRLVESAHPRTRPILGALCFSLQDGWRACPTLYTFRPDGLAGRIYTYEKGKTLRCLTGSGCLLIHRSALEKMRERQFDVAYPWFQETRVKHIPAGEDLTFCIRAESLGIPVHVDTSIACGHEKPFIVDEAMYDAQRAAGTADPADPVLPTVCVIPAKNRHDYTRKLLNDIATTASHIFVFDNGSNPPYGTSGERNCTIEATPELSIHEMWNRGLDAAREMFPHEPYNVAILNNDIEVGPDFLARLEAGLRSRDDIAVAYPDWRGLCGPGEAVVTPGNGKRTIAGWAFMLRGEDDYRFDEQFEWWFGDDDLQRTVEEDGKHVVAVGVACRHLEPNVSTMADPDRQDMARRDKERYAKKWAA